MNTEFHTVVLYEVFPFEIGLTCCLGGVACREGETRAGFHARAWFKQPGSTALLNELSKLGDVEYREHLHGERLGSTHAPECTDGHVLHTQQRRVLEKTLGRRKTASQKASSHRLHTYILF